jgi:hypothetical protein
LAVVERFQQSELSVELTHGALDVELFSQLKMSRTARPPWAMAIGRPPRSVTIISGSSFAPGEARAGFARAAEQSDRAHRINPVAASSYRNRFTIRRQFAACYQKRTS